MKRLRLTCDDDELVRRMQQDDVRAFEELYRRYVGRLSNSAYKRLKDKELTEEIVQDLFVNLWIKRHQLSVRKSVAVYLHTALRNAVIDWFRQQARRQSFLGEPLATEVPTNDTEDRVFYDDLQRSYRDVVELLPDKCRRVYELHQRGQSVGEIAELLRISPKTVESHLLKASHTLRDQLRHFAATLGGLVLVWLG
jgi:RNA polymerase sigma-70 factor (ECF subfamily)